MSLYNLSTSSGHLDNLNLGPGLLVPGPERPEVLVQEVGGGAERDEEPAQHHGDGPGQVHGLCSDI